MAQLTTADVTYTLVSEKAGPSDPLPERIFTISFGDGTATYTNGGIPLIKGKLGCPETVQSFSFIGQIAGAGNVPIYNYTANTIQLYRDGNVTAAAAAALTQMLTSAAVPATTLRVRVIGY